MPPKDKSQRNVANLKVALKRGKGVAKQLQSIKKQLQDLRKQSKRLKKK
jgi:hypothetical protein